MPNYKDRPDIPAPLLKALVSDVYEESLDSHMESLDKDMKGSFSRSISVTTLSRSPRQRILFGRHTAEITLDPEDRFWAILGRTIHSILEQNHGPDDVVEERLGVVLPDMNVYLHGAADVYNLKEKRIEDWKFTKSEAMLYSKEDHEAQLNVLAYIWRKRGNPVESLRNTYLFRNWEARKVKEGTLYPKGRILVKDVPLWPDDRILEFINSRVSAHFSSESLPDDDLPLCTDAERWVSAPTYRVLKVDDATGEPQKMAKHTASSRIEAEDKVSELISDDWARALEKNNRLKSPKPEALLKRASFIIQERKASARRCGYCEARSFCSQFLAEVQSTEEDEA